MGFDRRGRMKKGTWASDSLVDGFKSFCGLILIPSMQDGAPQL